MVVIVLTDENVIGIVANHRNKGGIERDLCLPVPARHRGRG